jgi:release factor glutamine methyltransferase
VGGRDAAVHEALTRTLRAAGCVEAEDEATLLLAAAGTPAELDGLVTRRVDGEPLEHILGWAAFGDLRIAIDPGVFVPRPRSLFLVEQAVSLASEGAIVVDLCCGAGAIGLAIATSLGRAEVHAVDVEQTAVACAGRNLATVGGYAYEGDLDEPLPSSLQHRVDLLVANPPHVPSDQIAFMPREARDHEPRAALDGGSDGLRIQRRIAAAAPRWLAPGGHLLLETGEPAAPTLAGLMGSAGLTARIARSDDLGATVVIGRHRDPEAEASPG